MNLADNIKIDRVQVAVAAGSTGVDCDAVDMSGFDGVIFLASFGALTATQVTSIKAQQGNVLAGVDITDASDLKDTLVGPLADGDGTKVLGLDIVNPLKRYVRCVVNRATANAVIDGVIAIRYAGRKAPQALGVLIKVLETHASPAEGTA